MYENIHEITTRNDVFTVNCFLIGLSPRIPRNPCTEKCTLKRLEMAQNEKVFCDESLNRRRYRLGVKKQNVALDETFQMSLLGAS